METVLQAHFFSQTMLPDANEAVASFVSSGIGGHSGDFGPCCTMGVFKNSELTAGVVYSNFQVTEGTIELSAYSKDKRWFTREILSQFIDMPFSSLGCQALIARHNSEDKPLRRMWKRIGAVEYIIPRLSGRDNPPTALTILTDDAWMASGFKKVS